jgi:hypothetical protein
MLDLKCVPTDRIIYCRSKRYPKVNNVRSLKVFPQTDVSAISFPKQTDVLGYEKCSHRQTDKDAL